MGARSKAPVRASTRWGSALLLAAVIVAGIWAATYFLQDHEAPVPELVEASVVDAAVDARAPAAKAKGGKKAAPRGGKTRVAGRAAAPHAPAAAPAGKSKTAPTAPGHHDGHHDRPPSGPSYESALDSNDEQVTIGAKGQADLTDGQLSAPMGDGTFLDECGAPESMSVTVKVAIRMGHAVGVSVETSPPSGHVVGCIDRHVRSLSWPASAKLDSLVTTY